MINTVIIENSKKLFQFYIPNLLSLLTEIEFINFLENSSTHTILNDGITTDKNFLATFFMLIDELEKNESQEIRYELGYFNFLLGEFNKFEKNKEFKNLVLSILNNLKKNDFKNILGEIAVCLLLSNTAKLLKYENIQQNNKSIDFEFEYKDGRKFLVEVLNIDYKLSEYEKGEPFEKFICGRLTNKFNEKSKNLSNKDKNRLLIFPIIHGISIEIVRENKFFLTTINKRRHYYDGFNSFNPLAFAKVQNTYFNIFTMEEIAIGELNNE